MDHMPSSFRYAAKRSRGRAKDPFKGRDPSDLPGASPGAAPPPVWRAVCPPHSSGNCHQGMAAGAHAKKERTDTACKVGTNSVVSFGAAVDAQLVGFLGPAPQLTSQSPLPTLPQQLLPAQDSSSRRWILMQTRCAARRVEVLSAFWWQMAPWFLTLSFESSGLFLWARLASAFTVQVCSERGETVSYTH